MQEIISIKLKCCVLDTLNWSSMNGQNGIRSQRTSNAHLHISFIKEVQDDIRVFKKAINKVEEGSVNKIKNVAMSVDVIGSEDNYLGDLYCSLRPIFIFGRIIGLIPLSGFFSKDKTIRKLQFRWTSLATSTNILVCALMTVNVIFSLLDLFQKFAGSGGGNASEMAIAARTPLFYIMAVAVYTFFLFRSRTLIRLFEIWRSITEDLGFKEKDAELCKYANVTAGIVLLSTIVEIGLKTLTFFPIYPRSKIQLELELNFSDLETYYRRADKSWAQYIPYHPVLTILLFLCDTLAAFAWNFSDILIVLLSRALYFKFKVLVQQTEKQLISQKHALALMPKINGGPTWAQVRRDHLTICKLLDELEEFLSPLIFLSYGTNIYFVCLQLHQGLTPSPNRNWMELVHSAFSFAQLIGRVLAVSLIAAKVNEYAHKITNSLQKCKTTEYCKELERLERMLATGPIGLSGLGCFIITRAFMLMVVSVIFTFEIVLLQASASSSSSPNLSFSPTTAAPKN